MTMTATTTTHRSIGAIRVSARPFADYTAQFALTDDDLKRGPILDCPGGASDFAATVRALGGRAVSADPCYGHALPALNLRVDRDFDFIKSWTSSQPGRFALDEHNTWRSLKAWRAAADTFLTDIELDRSSGLGWYVAASLPRLPFADNAFALGLSGFLLFTYPEFLDFPFHVAAIHELLRVAADVRVHPLNDSARNPYPCMNALTDHLAAEGVRCELLAVPGQSDTQDRRTLRLSRT